jgi:NADPH-dependent ferric siderophore reductase
MFMAGVLPDPSKMTLDDPFAVLAGPLAGTSRLSLQVVEAGLLTPHMRRLRLTAPELAGFSYAAGQDVMLLVDVEGNRPVRRRYTIRALDTASAMLTLDIVLHGDGPGERWVRDTNPGDRIEGIGPRGKITTAGGADWHLFVGDESALPAIFRMAESLPGGTPVRVLLEIPGPEDEQDLRAAASTQVTWLHRGDGLAGEPGALAAAVGEVPLPAGRGHAYLLGEARVVSRLREVLAARGLEPDQMSPKAYWGRGRANASHGEPARDA